jgi:hypothetical protein
MLLPKSGLEKPPSLSGAQEALSSKEEFDRFMLEKGYTPLKASPPPPIPAPPPPAPVKKTLQAIQREEEVARKSPTVVPRAAPSEPPADELYYEPDEPLKPPSPVAVAQEDALRRKEAFDRFMLHDRAAHRAASPSPPIAAPPQASPAPVQYEPDSTWYEPDPFRSAPSE